MVTIEADASLREAQRLFVEKEISGTPVVDDDGRVVAVLSARGLLRGVAEAHDTVLSEPHYYRGLAEFSGPDWANGQEDLQNRLASRTVSDAMTEGACLLAPDTPARREIAGTLRQSCIHRVLIARDGVRVGIASTFDLMGLLEKRAALARGAGQSVSGYRRSCGRSPHPLQVLGMVRT